MNLLLGADVREPGGNKLGEVTGVVYSPQDRRVMALAIEETGPDAPERLVTVRAVGSVDADGGVVYLSVDRDGFDRMRLLYEDVQNVAGVPDAANVISDSIKEPWDVPDVPPVGAAEGVESIAYTPLIQESTNLRPQDALLARSTLVLATDGDVGHVKRVLTGDGDDIDSLVASEGLIFHRDVLVPASAVQAYGSEQIELTVRRDELPPYTPA